MKNKENNTAETTRINIARPQGNTENTDGPPIMKMGGTNFYTNHAIRKMPLPTLNKPK